MSKYLKSPNLLQRETPEALDRRILLAGAIAAAQYRNRRARRRRFIGALTGLAAAFMVAVVATWQIEIGSPAQAERKPAGSSAADARPESSPAQSATEQTATESELLELNDWTAMEQENFNLASQVNCYQDVQDNDSSSQV